MRSFFFGAALACVVTCAACGDGNFSNSEDAGDGFGGAGDPRTGAGGAAGATQDPEPETDGTGGDLGPIGGTGTGGESGAAGSPGASGSGGDTPGSAGALGHGGAPGRGGSGGARVPEDGVIPMFVAVGRGGRTMMSCDDGKTWINDRQLTSNNGDHEEETDKGFAYGNGHFVQLLGWGAPVSLQISEDGVEWRRVYPEGSRWSTISFLGDRFMMMNANEAVTATSPDGPWSYTTDHGCNDHMREGGGGAPAPGIMMGACGSTYTTDGGETWSNASACSAVTAFGGIGQRGGFAYGNGVFAAVDEEGDYCSTADKGTTWRSGQISNFRDGSRSNVGKMFFANGEFWMMVGNKGHRSSNGANWSTTSFSPSGIILHAIAASDTGAYVAYDRESGQFYRSADGESWSATTKVAATPTFQRLTFGYGRPSNQCPGH